MITSFFNKSKPNNYSIIFLLTLLGFFVAIIKYNTLPLTIYNSLKLTLNFVLTCLSIFVINFIAKRNDLTKDNTYAILVYVIGLLLVPQTFLNVKIIISNLFIILAIRRLLSLISQKDVIKKLLDFGILLAIATLFNKWAIYGYLLVFIAVFNYPEKKTNYWFLPIIGFLAISVISYAIYLYIPDFIFYKDLTFYYQWITFTTYDWTFYLGVMMFLILALFSSAFFMPGIIFKKRVNQPAFYLIFFALIIFFIIALIQPIKTASEVLFFYMPTSIIIANTLQFKKIKIINNILLAICFIIIGVIIFV